MSNDPSGLFLSLVMFIGIFYFLIYRPQQKHRKQRQELMDQLQLGKQVITIGGIHGEITAINDETVDLKIAENVVIVLNKSAVAVIQEEDVPEEVPEEVSEEVPEEFPQE